MAYKSPYVGLRKALALVQERLGKEGKQLLPPTKMQHLALSQLRTALADGKLTAIGNSANAPADWEPERPGDPGDASMFWKPGPIPPSAWTVDKITAQKIEELAIGFDGVHWKNGVILRAARNRWKIYKNIQVETKQVNRIWKEPKAKNNGQHPIASVGEIEKYLRQRYPNGSAPGRNAILEPLKRHFSPKGVTKDLVKMAYKQLYPERKAGRQRRVII